MLNDCARTLIGPTYRRLVAQPGIVTDTTGQVGERPPLFVYIGNRM